MPGKTRPKGVSQCPDQLIGLRAVVLLGHLVYWDFSVKLKEIIGN